MAAFPLQGAKCVFELVMSSIIELCKCCTVELCVFTNVHIVQMCRHIYDILIHTVSYGSPSTKCDPNVLHLVQGTHLSGVLQMLVVCVWRVSSGQGGSRHQPYYPTGGCPPTAAPLAFHPA